MQRVQRGWEGGGGANGGKGKRIDGLGMAGGVGWGGYRKPTERRDKALTPLSGCILAGRQLWIGNITAAGN